MDRPSHIALATVVVLGSFAAGAWYSASRTVSSTASGVPRALYYYDPMHPAYRSEKPGVAPDCGMELEPMYADATPKPAPKLTPGALRVSPEAQQLIGIRTVRVERAGAAPMLRTTGRVSADETRIYRLTSASDGWIRTIYPNSVGSLVRKGQPLLTFYTRDFLGNEQAYFYALDSLDRLKQAGAVSNQQMATSLAQIQQGKEALQSLGMDDSQIAEITRTRRVTQEISLLSPVTGLILSRNVSPGQRFDRAQEFYRIIDLSRVWILADIFENEAGNLRAGATASVHYHGRSLRAQRSDTPPQFDALSRTLRVRFETANPSFRLRPDMFVDVELALDLPQALTVPADAVIDSGRRKTVFVERGGGVFEPRAVETGWRYGDRVAVTRGLREGEQVVAAGNFLLDSESRMRVPAEADDQDPVCGMTVRNSVHTSQFGERVYRLCSPKCKHVFDDNPERFAGRGV